MQYLKIRKNERKRSHAVLKHLDRIEKKYEF